MTTGFLTNLTGRRVLSRLAGLSFERKACIAAALLLVTLFSVCLAAAIHALETREHSRAVVNSLVPALQTSFSLEQAAYEAAHHATAYALSGDMDHYSGARIRLASLRAATALFAEQTSNGRGTALQQDTNTMREHIEQLDALLEAMRDASHALAAGREDFLKAGDELLEHTDAVRDAVKDTATLQLLREFAFALKRLTRTALAGTGSGLSAENTPGEQKRTSTPTFSILWDPVESAFAAETKQTKKQENDLHRQESAKALADMYAAMLEKLATAKKGHANAELELNRHLGKLTNLAGSLSASVTKGIAAQSTEAMTAARRAAFAAGLGAAAMMLFACISAIIARRGRRAKRPPDPA